MKLIILGALISILSATAIAQPFNIAALNGYTNFVYLANTQDTSNAVQVNLGTSNINSYSFPLLYFQNTDTIGIITADEPNNNLIIFDKNGNVQPPISLVDCVDSANVLWYSSLANGNFVAFMGDGVTANVFDTSCNQISSIIAPLYFQFGQFGTFQNSIFAVSPSADGSTMNIYTYDSTSGALLNQFNSPSPFSGSSTPISMDSSSLYGIFYNAFWTTAVSNGQLAVVYNNGDWSSPNNMVAIVDSQSGSILNRFPISNQQYPAYPGAFPVRSNPNYIMIMYEDGTIEVRSIVDGSLNATFGPNVFGGVFQLESF